MAVQLNKAQLPELLMWLDRYLPHSFKIHGELDSHLKGRFPDLLFYVDKWPEPHAAVALVDPKGEKLACKSFYQKLVQGVYGVTEEALLTLLKDSTAVDWNTRNVVSAVPDSLWPAVHSLAKDLDKTVHYTSSYLLKASVHDLKLCTVPEGIKLSSISVDNIPLINSTWKHQSEGSESFIQELVLRQPSVFLSTNEGQPIGHMTGQGYGTMGMLYVHPEFRRKGFAKVIVSLLAQKYFERGEDAYVIIEEDNPISIDLHQSLGFQVVSKVAWMTLSSKSCCKSVKSKCCV